MIVEAQKGHFGFWGQANMLDKKQEGKCLR